MSILEKIQNQNIIEKIYHKHGRKFGWALMLSWISIGAFVDAGKNIGMIAAGLLVSLVLPMAIMAIYDKFGPSRYEEAYEKWERHEIYGGAIMVVFSVIFFIIYFSIRTFGTEIYQVHKFVVVDEQVSESIADRTIVRITTAEVQCVVTEYKGYWGIVQPTGKIETVNLEHCQ